MTCQFLSMDHISLTVKGIPDENTREMLIAHLLAFGFESFNEEETAIDAYIPEDKFSSDRLEEAISGFPGSGKLQWDWCRVSEKNWNAEWEKDYRPVLVAGRCFVRAPFHEKADPVDYDIVITPKMSFGTAHHESTRLMIEMMLQAPLEGKTVVDMGCGTAVLAILANKMGAECVYAIDNNEWAIKNALENVALNHAGKVSVIPGEAGVLAGLSADIILANINRNVLLEDVKAYVESLRNNGLLILSGFLETDAGLIDGEALKNGLEMMRKKVIDNWVAVSYRKK